MERNTVKLTKEAKEQLDWLKSSFNFTSFSVCIETIGFFFKNNKINPRDLLTENYTQAIYNLKKDIHSSIENLLNVDNNNTERIIKINRKFEIDYLKPMNIKLFDIHKNSIHEFNQNSNEKIISNITEDSKKIIQLNEKIEIMQLEIQNKKNELSKATNDLSEYHRCLKTLNENMKIKDGIPFINLPVNEAEDLFYLIP